MWFFYALITTCAWGAADLFYKKGADSEDRYSHLKTSMMVGIIMGLHAAGTLIFKHVSYDPMNIIIYFPVSLMYILSMTVGYFGLRYLELSLSSPIQNSSGAVTSILCFLILGQTMGLISFVGVILICGGIFLLGVFEKRRENDDSIEADKKYKIGFVAFLMPILYCIIDALGTFFDAYYLDDVTTTPLVNVTSENFEDVANISYEFTFLIAAVLIFIFIRIIKKQRIAIPEQKNRTVAALFETAGQATYVFALSGNGVVAAPMIASYSIISLILSRIFLKEKLTKAQYAMVAVVLAGIALLGLADGLAGDF